MKRFSLLLLVVAVAAIVALAGCPKPDTQPEDQMPAMGGEEPADGQAAAFSDAVTPIDEFAPDFEVADTDGNPITKADYTGKVLVMDFWSTTCPACVKKLDEYKALYDQYQDTGVEWLAVSLDTKPEVAAAGAADHAWPYRIAMYNDELIAAYFEDDAIAIPQVRIIDRDGNLRYSFSSASTVQDLELALAELAEETVGGDESATEEVVGEAAAEAASETADEAAPEVSDPDAPGLPDSLDGDAAAE